MHPSPASTPARISGLRAIAAVEAAKGVLVLAVGAGVLTLIHRDLHRIATEIVGHFHLNPASRYPGIFLDASAHLDEPRLLLLSAGAAGYAALRLAEAWGLWHARRWAEWLGAASGGIYLPIETYEVLTQPGVLHAALLAINLLVVGYLVLALRRHQPLALRS